MQSKVPKATLFQALAPLLLDVVGLEAIKRDILNGGWDECLREGFLLHLTICCKVLKTVKLPHGALLFVVVPKNDPIIPFPTIETEIDAMRGNQMKYIMENRNLYSMNVTDPFLQNSTASSYSFTQATCDYIFDRPCSSLGFDLNQTYTVSALGQQHFLKVYIVSDRPTGLIWADVIVVPNRTVMGPILDGAMKTRVQKNSGDTKKSEDQSNIIVYAVLASVVLGVLCVAVFFTLVITKPMVALKGKTASYMNIKVLDLELPPLALEKVSVSLLYELETG